MWRKMKILRLLSSASIIALVSGIPGEHRIAEAAIPVVDQLLAAAHAKELAQMLKDTAMFAQQLKAVTDMLTLQNIAGLVLGEGPGQDFSNLMTGVEGLYSNTQGLIYSVTTKQQRLTDELMSLMPGSMEGMSMQQIFQLANRWKTAFQDDTIEARRLEIEGLRVQSKLREAAMRGVVQADRSRSAVSATQSLSHIAGAMSGQLDTLNTTLSKMAQTEANQVLDEKIAAETMDQIRKKDLDSLRQLVRSRPGVARMNPLNWGS